MRLAGAKRTWASVLAVLGALLVLAAPAAAEVRSGSATSPEDPSLPGEVDILSGGASYDTSTGTLTLTITTREAPGSSGVTLVGGGMGVEGGGDCGYPVVAAAAASNQPSGTGLFVESEGEFNEGVPTGPVQKSVSGNTTTLTFTSSRRPSQPFNCAFIEVSGPEVEEEEQYDELEFPVNVVETPPPTNTNPPSSTPPATDDNAPATPKPAPTPTSALTFGKSKTVKAKPGQWTKVTVQLSNPGTGSTGAVALKVKAPAGVKLKPGSGKVTAPALGAGKSETVTFKVELTEKAKAKSKLSLTATSGALSAKGSVTVKRQG
jgi:hypothetical protein